MEPLLPDSHSPKADLTNFLDELENKILDENIKLKFRKTTSPQGETDTEEHFPNAGLNIVTVFEILDDSSQVLFKLGVDRPKNRVQHFVISNKAGFQSLTLVQNGCLIPNYKVEGAGLLPFTQSVSIRGYTLSDPYKDLLQIRTGWIRFFPFLLHIPSITARLDIVNLDGSPSGTLVYKEEGSNGFLTLNFIRGLDRKAKYMLFAACLLPLMTYFAAPNKLHNSLLILFTYFIILLGIVAIVVWQVCSIG